MSGEDRYMKVTVSVCGRGVWDFTELYVLRLYLKTPFVIHIWEAHVITGQSLKGCFVP